MHVATLLSSLAAGAHVLPAASLPHGAVESVGKAEMRIETMGRDEGMVSGGAGGMVSMYQSYNMAEHGAGEHERQHVLWHTSDTKARLSPQQKQTPAPVAVNQVPSRPSLSSSLLFTLAPPAASGTGARTGTLDGSGPVHDT